jgi:hypothetical protein
MSEEIQAGTPPSWLVYRRQVHTPGRAPVVPSHDGPAVGVFYSRGTLAQEDALVLNAAARDLVGTLATGLPGMLYAEMLYADAGDAAPGRVPLVGIRPVPAGDKLGADTRVVDAFEVAPCRWLGAGGEGSPWSDAMRAEWPIKILAGEFMRHYALPETALTTALPAHVDQAERALVFPIALVTP